MISQVAESLQSSGPLLTARAALHMPFPICVWRMCSPAIAGKYLPGKVGSLQTRSGLSKFLVHNSLQNRVGKSQTTQMQRNSGLIKGAHQGSAHHTTTLSKPVCPTPFRTRDLTLWQYPFRTEGCLRCSAAFAFCPRNMDLIMKI